jgi:hypothetical protein
LGRVPGDGAVFGVISVFDGFDKGAGEIAEVFTVLLTALFHEEQLAEITEGGGAAVGDAVGCQGAEDHGKRGVNFSLRRWIVGEGLQIDVIVVLCGRGLAGFFELAVRATEAVKLADGKKVAVAAIGVFKLAKVEVGIGAFRRHAVSLLYMYILVKI